MKTVEIHRLCHSCLSYSTSVEDDDDQPLSTAVSEAAAKQVDLGQSDLSGGYLNVADLRWAQLHQADLSRSFLFEANLEHASLGRALLSGATLWGAGLTAVSAWGADFEGADLRKANLSRAELRGADLRRTNLEGATLTGADLSDAQLEYTNLHEANLDEIRADLGALLDGAPGKASDLLAALRAGDDLPELDCDAARPIARWLLPLENGHTPGNDPIAKITEGWIVEWIAAHSHSAS